MKVVRIFCSMPVMLLLGLFFVISLASATFIEQAYGTQTARALIYNARWMEIFYLLLAINLIGNGFYHQMWKKEKRISGCFHLSFFLILAGAGLTRYQGSSGQLHFREGEQTDRVISDNAYLQIRASGTKTFSEAYALILSSATNNHWQTRLGPGGSLHIRKAHPYLLSESRMESKRFRLFSVQVTGKPGEGGRSYSIRPRPSQEKKSGSG
jgi:hypothetical protein